MLTPTRIYGPYTARYHDGSTLFEVASLDAWSDVMYYAMDIEGKGLQPSMNANNCLVVWLFFISFILIR